MVLRCRYSEGRRA